MPEQLLIWCAVAVVFGLVIVPAWSAAGKRIEEQNRQILEEKLDWPELWSRQHEPWP